MDIVTVQYRDPMRPVWQVEVEDGSAYTSSANGVTQVFGHRNGASDVSQLGAFPDEAITGVTIQPATQG